MNGAEIIVRALAEEKTGTVFGYPGAAILPVYDAFEKFNIRHILVRQEQNAGHAASGYARVSGKVGVCIATSGPGATNLITALATACMDSIPVVAITGQVPLSQLGRDVFQEADITGSCEPFTKYSYLVTDVNDLPRIMKEAFYIASAGRPGPVLIDVPVDVQLAEYEKEFVYPEKVKIVGYKPRREGNRIQLNRAIEEINRAERPIIIAGGGVASSGAARELEILSGIIDSPVVTTLMGTGVMPHDHPRYLGMLGTHGAASARYAINHADLLLICGARVGDRTMAVQGQTGDNVKTIHIDVDPAEIGKNIPSAVPIVGDIKSVLGALLRMVTPLAHREWNESVHLAEPSLPAPADGCVEPRKFIRLLCSKINAQKNEAKPVMVADVGQNQIWAANSFSIDGGVFLTSGGMGTMGYSLPAAIGASLASPKSRVVAVCGDGSFQMMMNELATLRTSGASVGLIVMRNRRLGMIRELQDRQYGGRHTAIDLDGLPDIMTVCRAYGIPSESVESSDAASASIDRMLEKKQPYVIVCEVDPDAASV